MTATNKLVNGEKFIVFVQLADLNVAKNDTSRDGKRYFQKQYREKLKRERIETPVNCDPKESCGSVDNGYVRLAAEILRSEFSAYRRALEKYDGSPESIGRIRSIEREILTPYYAALTMNAIDLKRYCNDLRKKYGIYGGIEDWAG